MGGVHVEGGQREKERENPKQAPCPAWSPAGGSVPGP